MAARDVPNRWGTWVVVAVLGFAAVAGAQPVAPTANPNAATDPHAEDAAILQDFEFFEFFELWHDLTLFVEST